MEMVRQLSMQTYFLEILIVRAKKIKFISFYKTKGKKKDRYFNFLIIYIKTNNEKKTKNIIVQLFLNKLYIFNFLR